MDWEDGLPIIKKDKSENDLEDVIISSYYKPKPD